jgi:membrane protein DedA with SNARE-associated domain
LRRGGKSLLIWALGKAIKAEVAPAMRGLIIAVVVIVVIAVVAYFLLSRRRRP